MAKYDAIKMQDALTGQDKWGVSAGGKKFFSVHVYPTREEAVLMGKILKMQDAYAEFAKAKDEAMAISNQQFETVYGKVWDPQYKTVEDPFDLVA